MALGWVLRRPGSWLRPARSGRCGPRIPPASQASPLDGWPTTASVPDGRVVVAVVLGASGSVISDALGPYEVFARSPKFHVYTVSAGPTATLSGGLVVVADHSLDDADVGNAPEPDVVVVPAVVAPKGKAEAPLRTWLVGRSERGAHVLGVCAGSALLAASGLLDGRRATSHWSRIRGLKRRYPQVLWERGKRYVEDDKITTTAGVTSGVFGALRLVEQLAGGAEADRVGRELAYPGWSLDAPVDLVAQRGTPQDLAAIMAVVAPWLRPTLGVGLVDGTSEIAVAAPFEVYANSWSAAPGSDRRHAHGYHPAWVAHRPHTGRDGTPGGPFPRTGCRQPRRRRPLACAVGIGPTDRRRDPEWRRFARRHRVRSDAPRPRPPH